MLKGWKTVSGIWQLCVKASAQQPAHSPAAVKAQGTTTRKKKDFKRRRKTNLH